MQAPTGTPREVIVKINSEVKKILAMSDIVEKLASLGVESAASTSEFMISYDKSEVESGAKWSRFLELKQTNSVYAIINVPQAKRDAVQRAAILPALDFLLRGARGCECAIRSQGDKGLHAVIQLADARQQRLRQFHRREFAGLNQSRGVGNREVMQFMAAHG